MKKLLRQEYIALAFGFLLFVSCSHVPDAQLDSGTLPEIFPDYTNVTVPVNIAPLNFMMAGTARPVKAVFACDGKKEVFSGSKAIGIPVGKWHKMMRSWAGKNIEVTVYSKEDGRWTRYKPFSVSVKDDPIDPWLAYRLIAPGYESWSEMGIYQRNLTNFDEETIIDNRLLPGNCMNCHSFNNNDPGQMMFHLRGNVAGTMLVRDGQAVKLNTKTRETISNCVYPYWHPSGNYIAFSVNSISQVFHISKEKRIEVMDSRSDIVVYDIKGGKLITTKAISSDESFETFPSFSPDGKTLYFCSSDRKTLPDDFNKIKYSLCSIGFDPASGTFGNTIDTLVSSFRTGKSVSFPRPSHNGKFMMFTLSDYGNFSIWHNEADLYLINLAEGSFKKMGNVNSDRTESYHSWSSGSHWFVFSSRRTDGLYTRPFFSWLDDNGNPTKPFMLPQKDPSFYDNCLRSFNVPELITGKVKTNGRNMLKAIGADPKSVTFELKD